MEVQIENENRGLGWGEGRCLAQHLRRHSRCLHPMLKCLGSNPDSTSNSSFLLMSTMEAAGDGSGT